MQVLPVQQTSDGEEVLLPSRPKLSAIVALPVVLVGAVLLLARPLPRGTSSLGDQAFLMEASAVKYTKYVDKNAFHGYGAIDIDSDATAPTGYTALQCQQRCTEDGACDCVSWQRAIGTCYKRRDCNPSGWTSEYNDGYDTYMKVAAGDSGSGKDTTCSWEGENCISTNCCRRTGFKCWERAPDVWASCSATCAELKQVGGGAEDWTCAELGGDRGSHDIAPLDQQGDLPYQSLFCFMVITEGGVVPAGVEVGYEGKIADAMKKAKASIFGCDGSAIYQGAQASTGEWKSIKNTDVFAKVWDDVKSGGEYLEHSWTVKVDADAVFFPDRLRIKFQRYIKPPPQTALYFHNIDFKFNFMGALEVMSKEAVDIFLNGYDDCLQHIGTDGGEDIFTMQCLDALGVGHMSDATLLDDKYAHPGNFNLFDVDACDNPNVAAFHPYKAVNSWMGCYKVAQGIANKNQFTSCDHRWEGEACSLSSALDHPGLHTEPGSGIVA